MPLSQPPPASPPAAAPKLAALDIASVDAATYDGGSLPMGQSALALKLEVLLDREGMSPGVIDGLAGSNLTKAVVAFEAANGITGNGQLSAEMWNGFPANGPPVLVRYTITADDLKGPFIGKVPEDYAEMAKLPVLGYASPEEMLAERFHMDMALLRQLNPAARFDQVGTEIVVADVRPARTLPQIARIEADKTLGQVRGYDEAGRLAVAFPATIGSAATPSPSGTHVVKAVVRNAAYYYRPDVNFQQGNNTKPLKIPPGPNNPIGSVWMDLSEPTYGIHGTPDPSKIGKTFSHGCVRLTNWDVERLATVVAKGVPVTFD